MINKPDQGYQSGALHRPVGTRWFCNTATYPVTGWCNDCTNTVPDRGPLCDTDMKRRGLK